MSSLDEAFRGNNTAAGVHSSIAGSCAKLNMNSSCNGSGNLSPTSAAGAALCGIPDLTREAKRQKVNRVLMSSLNEALEGNNKAAGVDSSIAGSCAELNLNGSGTESGNLSPTLLLFV